MPTNIKENGFETLIVKHLVNINKYEQGQPLEYDRNVALDVGRLFRFLSETQGDKLAALHLENDNKKQQFLSRLQGEIEKNGVIYILRKGFDFYPSHFDMMYDYPSEQNAVAKKLYDSNIFSVTRQVEYSKTETQLALDLVVFINGMPVATFELKNQFTKQNVEDAVKQYKKDRNPKELLFHFGRCIVHFAVDDNEVKMCTKLEGEKSFFLPFNKGNKDGAGNPVNPDGIKTDYLWKDVFTKKELTNIIENFAQIIVEKDKKTGVKKYKQIFPRFHQLSVVEKVLADVKANGVGKRYLIQHSAGSGKSNSIAWLAHQLVDTEINGKAVFDSIIVVTDRINLDKQLKNTVKSFMQVSNTVGHADASGDLKKLIASGKKIIITTVQKFQYILEDIGSEENDNSFAIIIDEAHSSQSGSMNAKMNLALSGKYHECEDDEDFINMLVEGRKMLKNASYFAFTATPKNKTLEMFGIPFDKPDGKIGYRPFHVYTMKQAIQEGFILDVLQNYTPIDSYYRIAKIVEDDPKFDVKKSEKKLRKYVENQEFPISEKAKIIVDHFHNQVIAKGKVNGQARAMVVCSSIMRAIEYYYALGKCLEARKSPFKCIVAFTGEKEYQGITVDESKINGFPSADIEDNFKEDPYRFLVVADKFQTGYDEPLLHTMYVDKVLTDIKAVQTLSRLNRAIAGKLDTFVLDFANSADDIQKAFQQYYKTTILSEETDPNKLYDLQHKMDDACVFNQDDINKIASLFIGNYERDMLDPILDNCVENYKSLDVDAQIKFKTACKSFSRTYAFLASVLDIGNADWERLSIFLNLLIPKLPTPQDDDLSQGILKAIDLESYRAEIRSTIKIKLEDEDAEIMPVPVGMAKGLVEPELDFLSSIIKRFHDIWGNIEWKDEDNIAKQIALIPDMVAKDEAYQLAMQNSDRENARIESDKALKKAMESIMFDNMELFKQFQDNKAFAVWLADQIFAATYKAKVAK